MSERLCDSGLRTPFQLISLIYSQEVVVTAAYSALLLIALVLPLGVALLAWTEKRELHSSLRFGMSILGGANVVILVWVWCYLSGRSFVTVRQSILLIWVLSLLIVAYKATKSWINHQVSRTWVSLLVPLLVFGAASSTFYLVPRTFDGEITQRQLMGPDAIGYANASAGLLDDGSFDRLKSVAIASSGHGLLYELFDQEIKAVYMIPDKSLSVKTEFLIGSLRIGFPSLVASVTSEIGHENLLSALHVTAVMFLIVGALLIFALVRSRGASRGVALLVTFLSLININLLVGYHEGGVAQAFVYSAVASFLVAAVQSGLSRATRVFLFVFAGIQCLSSYLDMFFVLISLTLVWLTVSVIRKDWQSLERVRLSVGGLLLSVLLLAPMSLEIPRFLMRRLADARQGGWNWDSWTELSGIIGIANPYFSVPDSIPVQLLLVLIAISLYEAVRNRKSKDESHLLEPFTLALVIVSAGFYVYSRYIMDHSTYQWFKLCGTLVGPFSIPLLAITIIPKLRPDWKKTTVLLSTLALVAALTTRTSFQYVRHYFGESLALSPALIAEVSKQEVRETTSSYQVFGHYGWNELALTPFWPAMYLNRADGGVRPIPREDLPVGLMIRESDCPQWECLNGISKENLVPVGSQYMIVDLEMTGSEVRGVDVYTQWIRVNRALAKLNAPYVEGNWTDLGPRLRYKD